MGRGKVGGRDGVGTEIGIYNKKDCFKKKSKEKQNKSGPQCQPNVLLGNQFCA